MTQDLKRAPDYSSLKMIYNPYYNDKNEVASCFSRTRTNILNTFKYRGRKCVQNEP